MEKEGVEFKLSVTEYVSVELTGDITSNGLPEMLFKIKEKIHGEDIVTEMVVDAVLVATGRRPNVNGMDLEVAGVEYDTRAGIKVNDKLQTTNSKVFAAGDCCSTPICGRLYGSYCDSKCPILWQRQDVLVTYPICYLHITRNCIGGSL